MASAADSAPPPNPTLVLEDNADKLRRLLAQLEDAVKQVTETIINDPKALGELAAKGKSVKDIPDVIPAAITVRGMALILETLLLLSDRALDRYALPSGVAAGAAVSAAEVAAAPEKKSSAGAVESSAGASGSPVAQAGPNRKQRRKQNKAAAAAADAVVYN